MTCRAMLTAKEREIVGMVREGASNKLIAPSAGYFSLHGENPLTQYFCQDRSVNRTELVSRTWMPSAQRTLHL